MACLELYCACGYCAFTNKYMPRDCPRCGERLTISFDEQIDRDPPEHDQEGSGSS
jgi:hypothetical protein